MSEICSCNKSTKIEKTGALKCHCGEVLKNHIPYEFHESTQQRKRNVPAYRYENLIPPDLEPFIDLNNLGSKPPEKFPPVEWKADQAIKVKTTTSFGKIKFTGMEQVGGMKPAKLMKDHWKIMEPNTPSLIISVVGGAKNFKLNGKMRETFQSGLIKSGINKVSIVICSKMMTFQTGLIKGSIVICCKMRETFQSGLIKVSIVICGKMRENFQSGLIKASQTTNAWLITSGFNMGAMKEVGLAVREGQSFEWYKDRFAHGLRCIGIAPWGYVKNRNCLTDHTIKVEGKFDKIAEYLTSNVIEHAKPVPLNSDHTHFIFVDDGYRNLYRGVAKFRARFEKKLSDPIEKGGEGIPVVLIVVEGGRDAIEDAKTSLEHNIPVILCEGTGRAADILVYAYTNPERGTKIRKLIKKAYFELKQADKDDPKAKQKAEDGINNVFESVKSSKSGEVTEKQRLERLKLALKWDRADIAQEEIFREDALWSRGSFDEAMETAILTDNVKFVQIILNQGVMMREFLTSKRLLKLYDLALKEIDINNMPLKQLITKLGMNENEQMKMEKLSKIVVSLMDKFDNGMEEEEDIDDNANDNDNERHKNEPIYFKYPYKQLLIWSALLLRQQMTHFALKMGGEPVTSTVAASRIHFSLAKYIHRNELSVKNKVLAYKEEFDELASDVLDECHTRDPTTAMMIAERRSPTWSNMTSMQMAASADNQTQKGQGRSNIVFSSSISIAEAIQAASHLKCELKLSEIEAEVEIGPINEDQTLHAAASIIRRQLQSLDISNETYPTPSEISLSYSTQHTPCLLTKFLLWIIDDKSYNGEDMSNRAGQQYAVQTFDQQLYAVAQQVKWSMPDVFHSHIIRLGGFHGLSCFIATVGKLWASAGLSDLLVDSGIYASNTVDQMLVGKQFNRGVRGLTLAYEALMVLLFKAFFNWCRDENRMKTIQPNVWKVFLDCHSSFAVPSTPQSTEDIEEFFNVFEEHIVPLFEEFRTHYCSISGEFVSLHSSNTTTEIDKLGDNKMSPTYKFLTFLTSPIVKFTYHSFLAFPSPTLKCTIRDWFGLLKFLDIGNCILAIIGFIMHAEGTKAMEAKSIFCINAVVFYIKVLEIYTVNSRLGPKMVMIKKMMLELVMFILVLTIFLLAYGVASQGLMHLQRKSEWQILTDVVYFPYWQLYGELSLEEIQDDDHCKYLNMTDTCDKVNKTDMYDESYCRQYHGLVPVFLAAYLMIGNILLLNLLIAIFRSIRTEFEVSDVPTGRQYGSRHLEYLQLFEKEQLSTYLRKKKAEAKSSTDISILSMQKRIDELYKMIKEEFVDDEPATVDRETSRAGFETLYRPNTPIHTKEENEKEKETKKKKKKKAKEDDIKLLQAKDDEDNLFRAKYNKDKLFKARDDEDILSKAEDDEDKLFKAKENEDKLFKIKDKDKLLNIDKDIGKPEAEKKVADLLEENGSEDEYAMGPSSLPISPRRKSPTKKWTTDSDSDDEKPTRSLRMNIQHDSDDNSDLNNFDQFKRRDEVKGVEVDQQILFQRKI
ncbi:unnamed protein product [Mytilus edulis]|uniref:TRPM3 n=1 Tax=Mytilus edulis TaxID=6550 RepID=A0A8S3PQF1_MYTED|nr:unnamed protein product [Mytilus edulis]